MSNQLRSQRKEAAEAETGPRDTGEAEIEKAETTSLGVNHHDEESGLAPDENTVGMIGKMLILQQENEGATATRLSPAEMRQLVPARQSGEVDGTERGGDKDGRGLAFKDQPEAMKRSVEDGEDDIEAALSATNVHSSSKDVSPSPSDKPCCSKRDSVTSRTASVTSHRSSGTSAAPGAFAVTGAAEAWRQETDSQDATADSEAMHNPDSDDSSGAGLETLAEANPVTETEDPDDMPRAVPFERMIKPNKKWSETLPRLALPVGFFFVVLVSITVVSICAKGVCQVDGSETGGTLRETVEGPRIKNALMHVLGSDYFNPQGNASWKTRRKALGWILNKDPMQLHAEDENLVQRFILVLFYFQTTQSRPWHDCNPSPETPTKFCYKNPHPNEPLLLLGERWLSGNHECQWAGVDCYTTDASQMKVIGLDLGFNGLNGPLPWEVTKLSHLKELRLRDGELSGTVPSLLHRDFGATLEVLDLRDNILTGPLPVGPFRSLRSLILSNNTISGTIPSTIGMVPLETLSLAHNAITGTVPHEIFLQPSIRGLYLSNTQLSGTLPTEVGQARNLWHLFLGNTGLSGSIPSQIALLKHLAEMDLSTTRMGGRIPEELYQGLHDLRSLRMANCGFTGTISSGVGLLTNLFVLDVANNQLEGTLPEEISNLSDLDRSRWNGNNFSGIVPLNLCYERLVHIKFELVADCSPDAATGIPRVQCPSDCCTSCCDWKTRVCS
ncbi:Serine Threonine protein kinase [Seminavis robusta]|uniref:Serine Threonine protein kinase n=1 Tax=Seminavis robusta TaxID=568900 RepID=A0A9N8EBX4_9STRA|nr:Serine Threonine protein kinase [Seminavis robusta]|eukprot:Sro779_g201340.1 Serine Threonine protein kinase (728) ;mRNA; r:31057-33509